MIRRFIKLFVYALIPKSWFLVKCSAKEKSIYLTFDDGPSPKYTEHLLNLLEKHNAKATFFVIGRSLELNLSLGEKIVQQGHRLGNHSYSHQGFGKLPLKEQIWQVKEAEKVISRVEMPNKPRLFRAPQGSWNIFLVLSLIVRQIKSIHWSYDSIDFAQVSANQIVEKFDSRPVQAGEVILFHDDSEKCIEVLEVMLPKWSKQGFSFNAL